MNESIGSMTMSMDRVLERLSSTKESLEEYNLGKPGDQVVVENIAAHEAAITILSALQDEGICDAEALKDMIYDYKLATRQNKELHRKFETPAKALRSDGIFHCPECNHRVAPRHSFCHWCGKKLGGW